MCGLVGVFGNLYTKDINYFKDALVADSVRGFHSTGVAAAEYNHKDKQYTYWFDKKAITGAEAVHDTELKATYDSLQNYAIIGHNRWATQGAVNEDNAHPFHHGDIVLAHNGTLNSFSGLKGDFDTDSEHIAYTFNKERDVIKTIESLNGAFALVWYNTGEGTINFARNEERPLFLCRNQAKDTVYFASEAKMLEWCADRNNITLETEPQALPVGEWWSFDLYNLGVNKEVQPKREKFTPRKKYSYNNGRTTSRGGNVSYLPKPLPSYLPKKDDIIDFIVTEVNDSYNTTDYVTIEGWYFDEKDECHNVQCFRAPKVNVEGISNGAMARATVTSVAKTCTPIKFFVDERTVEVIERDEWGNTEKKQSKECSNCLQNAREDYAEYHDGIVLCSDCSHMEGELGLCH